MKLKRILSLLAATTMTVTALTGAMSVSAISADDGEYDPNAYYTSGRCGENANWLINTDCTLIISGTGEMSKCYEAQTQNGTLSYWGWENAAKGIQKLVVEEGISLKSDYNFSSLGNLTEAVFPSTVTNLHMCLSTNRSNLKDVWIYTKDLENTFDNSNLAAYPNAGSGTKWHIYQNSTTENSLRDGLKLTDNNIEYITEDQKFPEIENRTPIEVAEVTDTSGPCGLGCKYIYDKKTKILTISGKGPMFSGLSVDQWGYYKYKDEITEVVVEEGITYIGKCAFGKFDNQMSEKSSEYPNLTKLTLPSTVKIIENNAFYRSGLETISFSEGLEKIREAVFAYTPLSGDLNLPKSVNQVGPYSFSGTNITSVNLNEGMVLGDQAFENCNLIKEVTIPKGLIYLRSINGQYARENSTFARCESLEKVIIKGVGTVEEYGDDMENGLGECLFTRCTSLKEIIIDCKDIEYVGAFRLNSAGVSQEYGTFWMENNPTFYIYKNSTTEKTLRNAGYLKEDNTVYIADFSKLETAISDAESVETDKYTDESVSTFTQALDAGKAILEDLTSTQDEVDSAVKAINDAKNALEEKKSDPSESDPTTPSDSSDPTSPTKPTTPTNPTGGNVKKTTSPAQKASQAKATAEKAIKQAKITSLTAKAKGKKKITVSWKKVAKAVGYEVQASIKKNFKKNVINKVTTKNKVVFKKLKSKKKYFVRVRAYATYKDAKGKTQKVYSKWFKSKKKVKVK